MAKRPWGRKWAWHFRGPQRAWATAPWRGDCLWAEAIAVHAHWTPALVDKAAAALDAACAACEELADRAAAADCPLFAAPRTYVWRGSTADSLLVVDLVVEAPAARPKAGAAPAVPADDAPPFDLPDDAAFGREVWRRLDGAPTVVRVRRLAACFASPAFDPYAERWFATAYAEARPGAAAPGGSPALPAPGPPIEPAAARLLARAAKAG